MNKSIWISLLSFAILPALASADEWKDESGHHKGRYDRGWGERFGEPPPWARGRGYWDGHFKDRRDSDRFRHSPDSDRFQRNWPPRYGPPIRVYPQYTPPIRGRGDWDDDDYEDRLEEWEERREEQREDYEDWLEERRERLEELRERQWRGFRYRR